MKSVFPVCHRLPAGLKRGTQAREPGSLELSWMSRVIVLLGDHLLSQSFRASKRFSSRTA